MSVFRSFWKDYLKERQAYFREYGALAGEFRWYEVINNFMFHMSELFAEGKTEEFDATFDVIELWATEGDKYVRQACQIGLLETVKLTKGWDAFRKDFRGRLKPASRKAWDEI